MIVFFPLGLNLIDFDMDATQLLVRVNASWEKSVTNGDLIILQKMLRDENC